MAPLHTANARDIDWSALQAAYGHAGEAGQLMVALQDAAHQQDWGELWSHLCHQGTVYPASHAALPVLLGIARQPDRFDADGPLLLAGAIVAGSVLDDPGLRPCSTTIEALIEAVEARLSLPVTDEDEWLGARRALRQAWLGLKGEKAWSLHLDRLEEGELVGECDGCGADLYAEFDQEAPYLCHEDPVHGPPAARTPLQAGAPVNLAEQWLLQQALHDGDHEAVRLLGLAFGRAPCSACGRMFSVRSCVEA
ncbi:hypothetical protein [Stenotrophomonas sp. ATs4]|uniref:hypothetical protein n=1 Tax=Stenotrophomonas sp. ATs4 TaxID=3402766 RepID=UPI003F6FC50C